MKAAYIPSTAKRHIKSKGKNLKTVSIGANNEFYIRV
jgi:hypothetical protein